MTANDPMGYNYSLITRDPVGAPDTDLELLFVKDDFPPLEADDTQSGTNSVEVLDALYDRFIWLAHNLPDGTTNCLCDYETAAKAIKLAKRLVLGYEEQYT